MRIVILLILTVIYSVSNGQSDGNLTVSGQRQQIPLVFDQKDFGDRFSVLLYSDDQYDYYVIDMTKLQDRFERVYFMNLTYIDSRLINIDGNIEKDQAWFKAYYKNKEEEIKCLFDELKEKTCKAFNEMSIEEKSAWMEQFDKFHK